MLFGFLLGLALCGSGTSTSLTLAASAIDTLHRMRSTQCGYLVSSRELLQVDLPLRTNAESACQDPLIRAVELSPESLSLTWDEAFAAYQSVKVMRPECLSEFPEYYTVSGLTVEIHYSRAMNSTPQAGKAAPYAHVVTTADASLTWLPATSQLTWSLPAKGQVAGIEDLLYPLDASHAGLHAMGQFHWAQPIELQYRVLVGRAESSSESYVAIAVANKSWPTRLWGRFEGSGTRASAFLRYAETQSGAFWLSEVLSVSLGGAGLECRYFKLEDITFAPDWDNAKIRFPVGTRLIDHRRPERALNLGVDTSSWPSSVLGHPWLQRPSTGTHYK